MSPELFDNLLSLLISQKRKQKRVKRLGVLNAIIDVNQKQFYKKMQFMKYIETDRKRILANYTEEMSE